MDAPGSSARDLRKGNDSTAHQSMVGQDVGWWDVTSWRSRDGGRVKRGRHKAAGCSTHPHQRPDQEATDPQAESSVGLARAGEGVWDD